MELRTCTTSRRISNPATTATPKQSGEACSYTLGRWQALTVYLDAGHVNIDNNPIECTIRGAALGKKNYLFAGSDNRGQRAAVMYTLIERCKINSIDPLAYFKDG